MRKNLIIGLIFILMFWVGFTRWRSEKLSEAQPEPAVTPVDFHQIARDILTPNPQPTSFLTEQWLELSPGVAIKAIPYQYNGSNFSLQAIRLDPKVVTGSLQFDQQGKTIRQWAQDQPNSIISNAGFFKEENQPVGLLYIDGKRIDAHRVKPESSGLLVLNQTGIDILNLARSPIPADTELQNALQTYPILIDQGKVIAAKTLTTQDRRTAIGIDAQKNMYLFTSEYQHLGLYEFAKILEKSGLSLTEVLNLDGGGSTGIAINTGDFHQTIESETTVPTVLKFTFR